MVEARFRSQPIGFGGIGQKELPHCVLRHVDAVEIDILAADIGAEADDVTFVGSDDTCLELFEESTDLRELLVTLLADFDRKRQVPTVIEAKRDQRVSDGRVCPVGKQHVYSAQSVEIILSRLPAGSVVGLITPVEITDVTKPCDRAL